MASKTTRTTEGSKRARTTGRVYEIMPMNPRQGLIANGLRPVNPPLKAIVTSGLTKVYGKLVAVDHLSLDVQQGEIFGFLGPNGSGKTTTIRMLNTLTPITEGHAEVSGFDVVKARDAVRRVVGLVPQDMTLDRDMTGRENMRIQAKLYDVKPNVYREKEGDLFRLVGLEAVADKAVGSYSWGMQKRLELIMGLVHTPKVLFLDEPTLGLDAHSRQVIWRYIKKLNHDFGVTVFLTTHYLEEADALCDRIAIIDTGKLKAIGTPEELKETLGYDSIILGFERAVGPEELRGVISQIPGVVHISSEGQSCNIETTSAETTMPRIIEALGAKGIKVSSARMTLRDLNTVFIRHVSSDEDAVKEDEFRLLARERLLRERS